MNLSFPKKTKYLKAIHGYYGNHNNRLKKFYTENNNPSNPNLKSKWDMRICGNKTEWCINTKR